MLGRERDSIVRLAGMKSPTLIIFSGLPGSGKSTLASALARHLSGVYLRIDTIEQGLREICKMDELGGEGYQLAYRIAQENLRTGNTVIADSVNPWPLTRNEWNDVAKEVGAAFVNIEVICSNQEEHRKRVETRGSTVPGLKLPTWQEVLDRDYRAWDEERIVVDTSGRRVEDSLEELLSTLCRRYPR